MLGIFTAILVSFENPRYRAVERFAIKDQLELVCSNGEKIPADVIDISTIATAVEPKIDFSDPDAHVGNTVKINFPNDDFSIESTFFRSRGWGKRIILNFEDLDRYQYTKLVQYIFNRQQAGFGEFSQEKPISKARSMAEKAFHILFPKRR
jgi:hypothetical protein